MKKIYLSDITLRSVLEKNTTLSFREQLHIAEKLDQAKVDAIELPAISSNRECEIIYRTISESLKHSTVSIAVGDNNESFELAVKCIRNAKKACLQVVMPVSTVQMEYFYHIKAPMMLEKIGQLVSKAKKECDLVEFVAVDAFRADNQFLKDCAKLAFEKGASAVTICDSEGSALICDYIKVVKELKSICDAKVYIQPLNNLSMASALAVESINAGADGVKTSMCGNYLSTALFADIIRTKKYVLDVDCNIDITNVKTIENDINNVFENNQSIFETSNVGKSKISHKTTMKEVSDLIKELGYELSDSDVGKVYEEFMRLAGKKEDIDIKELEAIIASTAMQVPSTYHLVNFVVNSGNIIPATANVTLEKDGKKFTGVSTGDGPIDAAFHAIEQIVGHHYELDDFQVHAATKGRGAVGTSLIRLRAHGKLYSGNGASTDIIGACIRAFINALNKIVYEAK